MKKRKIILVVIGVIATASILSIVVPALIPTWKLGEVDKVTDVPDIGKYISDFYFTGKVKYVSMTQNFRPFGTTIMLVGKSTSNDFKKFFADPNGQRIYLKSELSIDSYISKDRSSHLKRLQLKFNEIPGSSPEDICGYKSIENNGRLITIKGAYRESNNRFIMIVSNTLKK